MTPRENISTVPGLSQPLRGAESSGQSAWCQSPTRRRLRVIPPIVLACSNVSHPLAILDQDDVANKSHIRGFKDIRGRNSASPAGPSAGRTFCPTPTISHRRSLWWASPNRCGCSKIIGAQMVCSSRRLQAASGQQPSTSHRLLTERDA